MCSHCGHRMTGQSAKAFSSAHVPLYWNRIDPQFSRPFQSPTLASSILPPPAHGSTCASSKTRSCNKYEVISRWLLTGLAVVLSRQNWQLLAKRGTLTATPQGLLKRYYQIGYPAGLKDKTVLPYALPIHNAITDVEWQRRVKWYCHSRYLADMDTLYAERAGSRFDTFYGAMDLTNPIQAMQYDQTEGEQDQSKRAN